MRPCKITGKAVWKVTHVEEFEESWQDLLEGARRAAAPGEAAHGLTHPGAQLRPRREAGCGRRPALVLTKARRRARPLTRRAVSRAPRRWEPSTVSVPAAAVRAVLPPTRLLRREREPPAFLSFDSISSGLGKEFLSD